MQLNKEDYEVLNYILKRCKENSEFLTYTINSGVAGIQEKNTELQRHAADMETFASAMAFLVEKEKVSPKLKKQICDLAIHKIQNYYDGKTFLRWDDKFKKKLLTNKIKHEKKKGE